jgi:hypothetical protein
MKAKPFTIPSRTPSLVEGERIPQQQRDEQGAAFPDVLPPFWRGPSIPWPAATPPKHHPMKVK